MHADTWPENANFQNLIALRRSATNETHQTARQELLDYVEVIPNPAPGQVAIEATVLAALTREYGFHWPSAIGGPYGITRLTPRRDELLLRIERSQLSRWAAALTSCTGSRPDGTPGLEWTSDAKDTVLTQNGGRIVLAHSSKRHWHKALDQAAANRPHHRTQNESTWSPAHLQPLANLLSATLRRIHLLGQLGNLVRTVDLFIHEHAGHLYLADRSLPSVAPIWISTGAPFTLWPAASIEQVHPVDPRARVLSLMTRFSEAEPPLDAAQALCLLSDFPDSPLARQAANHALEQAERVLANPKYASLHDAGGWIAQCIELVGEGLPETGHDPIGAPPGTDELLERFADTEELGKLSPVYTEAEYRSDPELAGSMGYMALREMLGWALAVGTRPAVPGWRWRRAGGAWTAQQPERGATIRAKVASDAGYEIQLASPDLPDGDTILTGEAHHVAASVLIAEYSAITATVADPFMPEHRNRLGDPQDVPPGTDPSEAELILAAPHRRILDITTLAGVLAYLDHRVGVTPGASTGHWMPDPNSYDTDHHEYLNSFTSWFMEYGGIPATRGDEAANTSSVDSPEFRRHLARHRAALDPFVTCYLAAADRDPLQVDFAERHAAGVQALRAVGFDELLARDPRHRPDNIARFAAAMPEDLDLLHQWSTREPASY